VRLFSQQVLDARRFPRLNAGKIERMGVRLIALDIDGTLLDSRWKLPEANRVAICEAARRGIEVALVTGRRYDFAMPVAQDLGCPLTMIVNNGGMIRSSSGETRLRHLLPAGVARSALQMCAKWREGAAVIFDRPRANQLMLERLETDDSIRYAYYSRNLEFIGFAEPLESCLTEDPLQVMYSGTVAEMEEAEKLLATSSVGERVRLAVTKYAARDFGMLDVLPPGRTKGAALAEWAQRQGLEREEILAIGDNHNDLEMLHFAGIPVVMGNCVPELKSYGWHETHSNDESGVAAAIEKFALREAKSCA
jgi:Cof subfamily protein (haloacid dehalogenase superfamily)